MVNFTKSFEGISPVVINTTQQGNSHVAPLGESSQIPRDREMIRRVFPTSSRFQGNPIFSRTWPQTPFRVSMNAGDLLLRQKASGGSNQIKGMIGGYHTTKGIFDNSHPGDGASGNQHYVYDSSVYIKYKKLRAKQQNYNDVSFAGNKNNGSYTKWMAIRRL